jgi:hypothetical protein
MGLIVDTEVDADPELSDPFDDRMAWNKRPWEPDSTPGMGQDILA